MGKLNGQQIIDLYREMVSDELSDTMELHLVNTTKDDIETEFELETNRKTVPLATTFPGQTYTTALALPEDFLLHKTVFYGDTPMDESNDPIGYQSYKDEYYIDLSEMTLQLGGVQNESKVISLEYIASSPDITLESYPKWPAPFHAFIPYRMARTFYMIDAPEKQRSWLPEWEVEYQRGRRLIQQWNHKIKLKRLNNRAASARSDSYAAQRKIDRWDI